MPERALPSKIASRPRPMPRFLKRVAIVSFVLVLGIAALLAALVAGPVRNSVCEAVVKLSAW